MKYMLFFTGVASASNSVGLKNLTTGEIVHEISTSRPTGKETRAMYAKYMGI